MIGMYTIVSRIMSIIQALYLKEQGYNNVKIYRINS